MGSEGEGEGCCEDIRLGCLGDGISEEEIIDDDGTLCVESEEREGMEESE